MHTFKQWLAYAAGRILPAAVGFGAVALYTRLLDPASFGAYALLLSTSFLVGMVAYSWLRVASLRMMASVGDDEAPAMLATILVAFAATSVVVGGVLIAAVRIYDASLGWPAALLTAACAVLSGWFELNVAIMQAKLRVGIYGWLQSGRALGALAVSVALIFAGLKANALLAGFAAGNCACFGMAGYWGSALRGRFSRERFRQFVHFGWPSSAAAISYFSNTFQRFALNGFGGAAAVGIFAAASDFSQQTVGLLMGTATLAGQPLAFRARDSGTPEQLTRQLRNNAQLVLGVGLPAAAGLIVLAQPISNLYLGSRFHVHSGAVVAIAAGVMLISGLRGSYFEQAFEIMRRTRAVAVNTAVRVVLTILFSLWAIPRYGPVGAASAGFIAETIGLGLSVVWARRVMHLPIPYLSWGKIAAASALMVGAVLLVPNRSTFLGLAASIVVGAAVYGAAVALTHLRGIRAHLGAPAIAAGVTR
jgi:O-antigen/teichoic acid export membrane protein